MWLSKWMMKWVDWICRLASLVSLLFSECSVHYFLFVPEVDWLMWVCQLCHDQSLQFVIIHLVTRQKKGEKIAEKLQTTANYLEISAPGWWYQDYDYLPTQRFPETPISWLNSLDVYTALKKLENHHLWIGLEVTPSRLFRDKHNGVGFLSFLMFVFTWQKTRSFQSPS